MDHPSITAFINRMYDGNEHQAINPTAVIVLASGTKVPVAWIPVDVLRLLDVGTEFDGGKLVYRSKPISS